MRSRQAHSARNARRGALRREAQAGLHNSIRWAYGGLGYYDVNENGDRRSQAERKRFCPKQWQDHAQKQAHEKVKPSRLGVSLLPLTREKQARSGASRQGKENPSHRRRTEPPREHLIALLFGVSAEGSKPHRGAVGKKTPPQTVKA